MFEEFSGVGKETANVWRGVCLSTLAVMVAVAFNNLFDSLLQAVVPFGERNLKSNGQVRTFRLLIAIFLLAILTACSILCSISFRSYSPRRRHNRKGTINNDDDNNDDVQI
jgi:hypothetical protein